MAAKSKRPTKKTKKQVKPRVAKCVQEGCRGDAEYRGNCWKHYQAFLRSVRAGETTWDELEAKGLATPPKKSGRKRTEFVKQALRTAKPKTSPKKKTK